MGFGDISGRIISTGLDEDIAFFVDSENSAVISPLVVSPEEVLFTGPALSNLLISTVGSRHPIGLI